MQENSIWNIKTNEHKKLTNNITTDVLIIGGGVAGILCGYELKERKIENIIVEKDVIGQKSTVNSTAFVTFQNEILYQDIVNKFGFKKAKEYITINQKAINKYKELAKKYDFDFKETYNVIYTNKDKNVIIKEKEVLNRLGVYCELIDTLPINLPILIGLKVNNQGLLHPLKLINELSKELTIYENSEVIKVKKNKAYLKNGVTITFNKVIIATHFPFINKVGSYYMKMHQRRSYVVSFKHNDFEGSYTNIDNNGYYFRTYNNHLIIGGNDRDNKEKCENYFYMQIKEVFKDITITNKWSNQDCITLDYIPYIGKYDVFHDNYYVITGFNMWGFTWAMAGAIIIADMIENNKVYMLTNPQRNILHKQLFLNLTTYLKNILSLKTPKCPHLKSKLNYNILERTYECPCHGSRFKENGVLLDGPATKDIEIDEIN